ncbi:hypothetical protein K4F52_000636 [Lecanicillium sp. MT-2017a]|nr:hypothetical protein K4F52_000636 [Lecanicillium sp. MT-2017a]
MLFRSAITAALAGVAAAVPSNLEARTNTKDIVAGFDDAPYLPLLPLLSPTGKYKELDFTGFEITNAGLFGFVLLGVDAQSKPNVIASGLQAELLTGPATIKTTGRTKSFDLKKFYWGCVLDTVASAASLAPACTLQVTGYNKNGEGIANQQFRFVPESLKTPMDEAVLNDDFRGLDRVEFHTENTLLVPLTATLYDDFHYTVHY